MLEGYIFQNIKNISLLISKNKYQLEQWPADEMHFRLIHSAHTSPLSIYMQGRNQGRAEGDEPPLLS